MSGKAARLSGSLPSGPEFDTKISERLITLRVGDRICAAHPGWMTLDQAAELVTDLTDLLAAVSRPVGGGQ